MNDFPTQNTGFIHEIRPTDYLAGQLPYEVVLPSGDWRPFLPVGEPQALPQPNPVLETFACVSFSNNNLAEISLKQQGFDFNFSDRFLAKISNTTPQGNSFGVVEDAARHIGRVNELEWPVPSVFTWNEYYATIPPEVLSKARFFDESYEFINRDPVTLAYYLKHSPIQISLPYPHPNHAVVLVAIEGTTAFYYDTYHSVPATNYLKTMDVGLIQSAMRLIIKPKNMVKTQNYKGELRIIPDFCRASTPEQWQAICKVFGVDPNAPQDENVT